MLCPPHHRLYEVFEEGQEFYIVTELVQGGELFDRIVSKSHYSEKECRDLIKVLLTTLEYMHTNNVVHRDLKPENLLLMSGACPCGDCVPPPLPCTHPFSLSADSDDTNIKIADFGFAKKISDLQPQEVACGTPGYVAPEILRGDLYGGEVDIWSLGVITYVLLAGYPPFYDDDTRKLFRKIKEARYYFDEDYWSSISPEAIDMIKKMICLDQKERWTAGQLLRHPWIEAQDEVLANKDITSTLVEMKRYNARRKLKAAANTIITLNRMKKMALTTSIRRKSEAMVSAKELADKQAAANANGLTGTEVTDASAASV